MNQHPRHARAKTWSTRAGTALGIMLVVLVGALAVSIVVGIIALIWKFVVSL